MGSHNCSGTSNRKKDDHSPVLLPRQLLLCPARLPPPHLPRGGARHRLDVPPTRHMGHCASGWWQGGWPRLRLPCLQDAQQQWMVDGDKLLPQRFILLLRKAVLSTHGMPRRQREGMETYNMKAEGQLPNTNES